MKIRYAKLILISALMAISLFGLTSSAYAETCPGSGSILTLPTWYRGLEKSEKGADNITRCEIDFKGHPKWMTIVILNIGDILAQAAGYAAFGFIVYGGFKYILAAGSSSDVQSAKKTITNAVIGLVISLLAVAIVNFVFGLVK